MLDLLAQTYQTYRDVDSGEAAGLAIFGGAFLVVWLAVAAVMIVSLWKVFEKAGRPGWAAIVPVYNAWVMAEVAGKPGWWGLASLIAFIPIIGPIVAIVVSVLISLELAKAFGKDTGFAVLLILLPVVGYPMLAFSDAKYHAPAKAA